MALVAKRERERPVEMIWLDGPEVTDEAMRAAAHRILAEKRRSLGIGPVDLTHLIEYGRDLDD
jgi:hypothetical protein